jgi:hypothetical protein
MASPVENIINSWLTNVVTKSNWTEGILHTDTMFSLGMNDINIYNIANNNCVLTELQPVSVDNPFNTGQELVITNTGYASPNLGGFSFDDIAFSDRVIITRFWAKIPIGYQVDFFGDEIGDNAISYWYSSNQGTGVFTEYVNILICGNTGTFSKANSFALFGEAGTIENPITWSIASASSYDLSSSYYQYFQTNRISEDLAVTTLDLDVTKLEVAEINQNINVNNEVLRAVTPFYTHFSEDGLLNIISLSNVDVFEENNVVKLQVIESNIAENTVAFTGFRGFKLKAGETLKFNLCIYTGMIIQREVSLSLFKNTENPSLVDTKHFQVAGQLFINNLSYIYSAQEEIILDTLVLNLNGDTTRPSNASTYLEAESSFKVLLENTTSTLLGGQSVTYKSKTTPYYDYSRSTTKLFESLLEIKDALSIGSNVSDHAGLINRGASNQHPMSAITGLTHALTLLKYSKYDFVDLVDNSLNFYADEVVIKTLDLSSLLLNYIIDTWSNATSLNVPNSSIIDDRFNRMEDAIRDLQAIVGTSKFLISSDGFILISSDNQTLKAT